MSENFNTMFQYIEYVIFSIKIHFFDSLRAVISKTCK